MVRAIPLQDTCKWWIQFACCVCVMACFLSYSCAGSVVIILYMMTWLYHGALLLVDVGLRQWRQFCVRFRTSLNTPKSPLSKFSGHKVLAAHDDIVLCIFLKLHGVLQLALYWAIWKGILFLMGWHAFLQDEWWMVGGADTWKKHQHKLQGVGSPRVKLEWATATMCSWHQDTLSCTFAFTQFVFGCCHLVQVVPGCTQHWQVVLA